MSNVGHDLVAVLDWGLGHASRCVPVIQRLFSEDREVTIASSGKALLFLREHFSSCNFEELPPYNIRYPYPSMVANLLVQLPQGINAIRQEQQHLRAFLRQRRITRIISDGRFGCWHPQIESIWLAHQLHIQHPYPLVGRIANLAYHRYIRQRFQQVWIPDRVAGPRLAGDLSKPIVGLPFCYLGPQSRFQYDLPSASPVRFRYLALLSGPEPQRSYLEHLLRSQLARVDAPTLLVRGVPGQTKIRNSAGQLHEVDWLLGQDLAEAVQQAETVICRSGYSTLMDAWYWKKPLLLVPTPGQTEQAYLARHWAAQGWGEWQSQSQLNVN